MERRYLPDPSQIAVVDTGDEQSKITGYAAVFFRADNPGTEFKLPGFWGFGPDIVERLMPGCFDRALQEDDVVALYNHNPDHVLGRAKSGTLKLSVDEVGLRYEITPPNSEMAAQVLESIKRGDLTGSSFAFIPKQDRWTNDHDNNREIREILECQLFDVGPVTYPSYTATTVGTRSLAVRCQGDCQGVCQSHDLELQRQLVQIQADAVLLERGDNELQTQLVQSDFSHKSALTADSVPV